MNLGLVRYSYAPTETEGLFYAPPLEPFHTMEQPWVWADGFDSGVPFRSCIPEGKYDLIPYRRGNGQKTWALVNESLGVFFQKENDTQRFKCLIHPGNTVTHTQGCVLPGVARGFLKGERAVLKSGFRPGYAMALLTKLLGEMSEGHTLTIEQCEGARYVS